MLYRYVLCWNLVWMSTLQGRDKFNGGKDFCVGSSKRDMCLSEDLASSSSLKKIALWPWSQQSFSVKYNIMYLQIFSNIFSTFLLLSDCTSLAHCILYVNAEQIWNKHYDCLCLTSHSCVCVWLSNRESGPIVFSQQAWKPHSTVCGSVSYNYYLKTRHVINLHTTSIANYYCNQE